MSPVISVVMSVYNGGPWLREAIESVLSQRYEDFEFIVINDVDELPRMNGLKFYSKKKIKGLPKPILIHRFLTDYNIL